MKSNYFTKSIGGIILGVSLLLGIGLVSTTTAQAQYRDDDYYKRQRQWEKEQRKRQREWEREQRRQSRDYRDGNYDPNYGYNGNYGNRNYDYGYGYGGLTADGRQTALNAGYNEGIKEGRRDRSRGGYGYSDSSRYQKATTDYNSRYGSRIAYQQYYRQGFQNGYRDGLRGY